MILTIPKGSWTHEHTYLCRHAYTHTQTCTRIHSGTDTCIHTPHVHTHSDTVTHRQVPGLTSQSSFLPVFFPTAQSCWLAGFLPHPPSRPLRCSSSDPAPRLFPFSPHGSSPADLVVECKNSRQWNLRVGRGEASHGRKAVVFWGQSSGGTKVKLYSSSESASSISGFQVKDSSHLPP